MSNPKGIINIVDATNIERNLYLTMQLMELDIPMVLALNMMDEVRENGGSILVNQMEEMLGIPVVPISAAKNEGINELISHAIHVAKYQERPGRTDFCDANEEWRCCTQMPSCSHASDRGSCGTGTNPPSFCSKRSWLREITIILERLQLDENEREMLLSILFHRWKVKEGWTGQQRSRICALTL